MTQVLVADAPGWLETVARVVRRGGLVAFPTDTVYGVGASAFLVAAVDRIYRAKGRREDNPIPVLLAGSGEIDRITTKASPRVLHLAEAFWPGPLTLVLPKQGWLPDAVSRKDTVGVRVPNHPVAAAILRAAGPMAVSSANRSGQPSLTTASEVLDALGEHIDLLVDGGDSPGGTPSTVVDCTTSPPGLIREGPIPLAAILKAWALG